MQVGLPPHVIISTQRWSPTPLQRGSDAAWCSKCMPPGPNKNVVSGFCEKEPPTLKQIIGASSNFFLEGLVLNLYLNTSIHIRDSWSVITIRFHKSFSCTYTIYYQANSIGCHNWTLDSRANNCSFACTCTLYPAFEPNNYFSFLQQIFFIPHFFIYPWISGVLCDTVEEWS